MTLVVHLLLKSLHGSGNWAPATDRGATTTATTIFSIRCSRQRLKGPWSPPSVPKDTRLAAPLLPEIRPQAEALLEALLLGVSEECALGTARSTSAGLLPLRAVCDGILSSSAASGQSRAS